MRKHRIVNKKRFASFVVSVILIIGGIDFVRFPEYYLPSWKYQLQNDIKSGNEQAIEYYNETYINNGRELFE